MSIIKSYESGIKILEEFLIKEKKERKTEKVVEVIVDAFLKNKKVIICGNGGSNCDASHFAEEFTGKFRKNRKPLPVISLSDSSHITCVANDFGIEYIFSRGIEAYGQKEDIFIGISTSGNSLNIIEAVKKAKELGLITICLLGQNGGKLKNKADYEFIIEAETADRIQELHMMILHIIIEYVERIMFPENY